jgi:hypothetical protein
MMVGIVGHCASDDARGDRCDPHKNSRRAISGPFDPVAHNSVLFRTRDARASQTPPVVRRAARSRSPDLWHTFAKF